MAALFYWHTRRRYRPTEPTPALCATPSEEGIFSLVVLDAGGFLGTTPIRLTCRVTVAFGPELAHAVHLGFELRKLLGKAWDALLELLDRDARPQLLFTAERMADDLRIAKQKIPAAVIHMMMGIH